MTAEDLDKIADALERAFPDLNTVRPCRLLGSGFHNTAIETAGGIVFRIGRDDSGPERYAREFRVLPWLSRQLPAPIPVPRWFTTNRDFPTGVIGYQKVQGEPFTIGREYPGTLAGEIAGFLLAFHSISEDEARDMGLSDSEGSDGCRETWAWIEPFLRSRLDAGEYERLNCWFESFIGDEVVWQFPAAVIHTDIWQENILVDGTGHLTGVLDFDHVGIGDPAHDIATLRHLGDEFAGRVREAYLRALPRPDRLLEHRAQRLWEYRELSGIRWALELNDLAEAEDGLRKLRQGPIFNP